MGIYEILCSMGVEGNSAVKAPESQSFNIDEVKRLVKVSFNFDESIGECFSSGEDDGFTVSEVSKNDGYTGNFDEILQHYFPKTRDIADREFVNALKAWLTAQIGCISDMDIYAMLAAYHLSFDENGRPHGDIWFAYNTEEYYSQKDSDDYNDRWNFCNWKREYIKGFDERYILRWLRFKNLDLERDDDKISELIFDLATIAITELHESKAIESHFGRKVPIIATAYDYYYMTAIRAVKANGADCLDDGFFAYCGI